jgi:hypothetical protein
MPQNADDKEPAAPAAKKFSPAPKKVTPPPEKFPQLPKGGSSGKPGDQKPPEKHAGDPQVTVPNPVLGGGIRTQLRLPGRWVADDIAESPWAEWERRESELRALVAKAEKLGREPAADAGKSVKDDDKDTER